MSQLKPSMAARLRSELSQEVLRALDVVCDAFEEELSPVSPPRVVDVANYELFYDCCRRLARYIEANMTTTPGFLEQMDRIILACHSGATGSVLRSVMTNELRIRRRELPVKNGCKRASFKVERGEQQPDISPANSTISGAELAAEGAREWGTRKRLSTKSRVVSKRARRSLTEYWRREDSSDEEKKEGGMEEEGVLNRAVLKYTRPVFKRARRRNCVRRLEQDFEGQEGNERVEVRTVHCGSTGERKKREEVGGFAAATLEKTAKSVRWNLRTTPQRRHVREHTEDNPATSRFKAQDERLAGDNVLEGKRSDEGNKENDALHAESDLRNGEGDKLEVEVSADESMNASEGDQEMESEVAAMLTELVQEVVAANATDSEGKAAETSELHKIGEPVSEIDQGIVPTESQVKNAECQEKEKITQESTVRVKNLTERDKVLKQSGPGAVLDNIDIGKIEKEMRQLVRNLETGEGSLDMTVARTRFQFLVGKLAGPADATAVSEPIDFQTEEDFEVSAVLDSDDVSSDGDDDPPVPGLCDARLRSTQQVISFKTSLRKAIIFVDAVLCQPPPGKVCSRNCEKIRARQCSNAASCRDPICRNWHKAEEHTERCKNPLCEFRNRILLREVMHQVDNREPGLKLEQAVWKTKGLELFAAVNGKSKESYTLAQITEMSNELGQLERTLDEAKEELDAMKHTRRVLLANLSAIGVKPQDDETDGFPSFEEHYTIFDDGSDVGNDC
ncbi:hypothetical protein PHYBOEH_011686 [Phytophthora boehmeriae]|uniref:Uncharacterized protein n=1 Tax=Phytophthora boehmeriae TaxID=109152 RepID=A0A8T1X380_9STRA|nr:hypothetical protein PHYBOEH_011686 [Phytophthora boehmeriae]